MKKKTSSVAASTVPSASMRRANERFISASEGMMSRPMAEHSGAAMAATFTGYTVAQSAAAEPLQDDYRKQQNGNGGGDGISDGSAATASNASA